MALLSDTVIVRAPPTITERIDSLADRAGLTRAQFMRMLLSRASESDLPEGLMASANSLRQARGVAL